MKRSLISLFGVLVVAATTALAQSHGSRHAPCPAHRSTQRATEHSATTNTPFDRLMGDAMSAMRAGMQNAPHTGDPDRDFVTMMIPHHQGAIDMAKALLLYGDDEQLRRLAQEIIADQESEIQLMQLWLKQHPAFSTDPKSAAHTHESGGRP